MVTKVKQGPYTAEIIRAVVHALICLTCLGMVMGGSFHSDSGTALSLLVALASGSNSATTGVRIRQNGKNRPDDHL